MANDTFIEERSLGLQIDQVPVVFDERSRRAFVVSNKFVLVFNPQTGKREEILRHDNTVVGCYYREGKLNTFTAVGEYCVWDPESGKLQFCKQLNLSSIAFVHTVEGGSDESTMVFVLGAEEGSTVQKVYRCSAELSDEDGDFSFECVFAPVPLPQSRRHIAFGKDFVVICRGKIVEMSPLFGSAKKAARYELLQEFERIVDNSKVVWNGVAVHGDAVYVTLNIGRVYVWRHVASAGLTGKNRSFFHPGQTEIVQAVSAQHTVFCGTGECSVARYGFVVEGAGRWQSATKLSGLQASVTAIWLSTDECVLAVVLENTRLLFVKTSTMTVLASAEQILWPIEKTLALKSDPLRPDMLVSNARPGVVQWIKPSEWKTKEELDVCEANVPNRVHVLYNEFHSWSEVSVCCLTTDMIVTVERQNNEDRTCTAKFWRRSIVKDVDGESFKVRLEDSFDFDEDLIVSVRGDEDVDAKNFVCKLKPLYNQEHTDEIFIGLDNKGYFYIFKADPERFGGWCYDRLHKTNWQKSSVVHQSSLRSNIFASINHLANSPDSTYLLLWNVDNDRLRVEHVEDSIANLKSVEWAPSGNETTFRYLLYASDHVIGSYDIEALCSMWTVACSGSSLFVTPSLCLAGNNSEYCIFDPEDGRKINAAKFSSDQKIVLATGDLSHYDFVGYDKEEMTVLRNASMKSETTVNPLKKKTPFSDLVEINTNEQASEETFALEATVANKLFDGAAPSLAPVTYLAPLFIRSCLIK